MKSVHLILGYYSNYLDICMLHYIALYKCFILIPSGNKMAKIVVENLYTILAFFFYL